MKTLDFTINKCSKVVDGPKTLADFQIHYTNLRGFHWNIVGKDFYLFTLRNLKKYDVQQKKLTGGRAHFNAWRNTCPPVFRLPQNDRS